MSVFNNKQFFVLLGLAGVAGYFIYRKGQKAVEAVNPLNRENVFFQSANEVSESLTDEPLSEMLFRWLQPDQYQAEQEFFKDHQ